MPKGAGFLEEVRCPRHDGQVVRDVQHRLGTPIQIQHDVVVTADDEQRPRTHPRQLDRGKVGPSASADDSNTSGRFDSSRAESGSTTTSLTESAHRQLRLVRQPGALVTDIGVIVFPRSQNRGLATSAQDRPDGLQVPG